MHLNEVDTDAFFADPGEYVMEVEILRDLLDTRGAPVKALKEDAYQRYSLVKLLDEYLAEE